MLLSHHKVYCPFCLHPLKKAEVLFRCQAKPQICAPQIDTLYNEHFADDLEHRVGRLIIPEESFVKNHQKIVCSACSTPTYQQVCPACHGDLPQSMFQSYGLSLGFLCAGQGGPIEHYIDALQTVFQERVAYELGYVYHKISPYVLDLKPLGYNSNETRRRGTVKPLILSFYNLKTLKFDGVITTSLCFLLGSEKQEDFKWIENYFMQNPQIHKKKPFINIIMLMTPQEVQLFDHIGSSYKKQYSFQEFQEAALQQNIQEEMKVLFINRYGIQALHTLQNKNVKICFWGVETGQTWKIYYPIWWALSEHKKRSGDFFPYSKGRTLINLIRRGAKKKKPKL